MTTPSQAGDSVASECTGGIAAITPPCRFLRKANISNSAKAEILGLGYFRNDFIA